ncbi:uncharacterized protein NDAI_0G01470 [Naumovozyma dairenensis CBS 421]|uniref:Uncharacterized protein n=1 Tax=Naumovozyma dairenensis (strain ATCC 10597 / BCRC 20456 / CBS 421 / NBRC 0211 / NRRL Y-12639) TaxID=1071378 RepID=G0WDR2_NAUDC|nr:hypothetical protein NDAI_0G01470 [Naumovozyma dairenensis CBS 421]CCD25923.2 hypothetical protein NDAI_0G01470 [Naumovozyma dairenensis CBS 421]
MKIDNSNQQRGFLPHDSTENVVLPKEKFSLWVIYLLDEYVHQLECHICAGLVILFTALTLIFTHLKNFPFTLSCCRFFMKLSLFSFLLMFLISSYWMFKLCKMNLQSEIKILLEVIECKPNASPHSWDIIACHMNEYLYSEGFYSTPNFFYDGSGVYRWFRFAIMKRLQAQLARENRLTDDGSEIGKYEVVAFRVFRETVDKYWADEYPVAFEEVINTRNMRNASSSKQDNAPADGDMV